MMAAGSSARARKRSDDARRRETERFEQRLGEILEHATDVFYEKGYEGASMRDLSRETGMSLAGLYYYFESKERLLYLIQKHTFETVIQHARERLKQSSDPVERLRAFIHNHVEHFLTHRKATAVLSHEDETLTNDFGNEVRGLKREYYKMCVQLLEDLRKSSGAATGLDSRVAAMGLFGMMNWIYTWHNPRHDANVDDLARQFADIYLNGVLNGSKRNGS